MLVTVTVLLLSACGAGPQDAAPVVTPTASAVPLAPPDDVVASVSGTSASIAWTPMPVSGAQHVDGYALSLDGGPTTTVGPDVTTYEFYGLTPGSRHTIKVWGFSGITPGTAAAATVVVPAAPTPAPSPTRKPTPTPTPTPTRTPTPVTSATPTPTTAPSPPPGNGYVAPAVASFTFLTCRSVSGRYQRTYRVVLQGGSYWYFGSQTAPKATADVTLVNSAQSMYIRAVNIGVGASSTASTGRVARVPLPTPYYSVC